MIDFLKENKEIIASIFIPLIVAVLGTLSALKKNSDRSQKIGSINGNNNVVINGDINKERKKNA